MAFKDWKKYIEDVVRKNPNREGFVLDVPVPNTEVVALLREHGYVPSPHLVYSVNDHRVLFEPIETVMNDHLTL